MATKSTLVVNLYAGPGAGKTTCAWLVAGELKKLGVVTEYVPEYAKELVWDDRTDLLDGSYKNQTAVLAEQNRRIERLRGKVEKILCTGNRALDAAVRLKIAGFDDNTLLVETDMAKTKDAFRQTKGDIYILAASAFGNEGKILEELKK